MLTTFRSLRRTAPSRPCRHLGAAAIAAALLASACAHPGPEVLRPTVASRGSQGAVVEARPPAGKAAVAPTEDTQLRDERRSESFASDRGFRR